MKTVTVAGPLKTRQEAVDTCASLGNSNHSIFSMGEDGECQFFVEQHLDLMPERCFGYSFDQLIAKQHK